MTSTPLDGEPRRIRVEYPDDAEYERVQIEEVADEGDGNYGVKRVDGWHLLVGPSEIVPEPGDWMRCYGRGIGYEVRGIVIEGKGVVRYETAEQMRERWAEQRREDDARKQRELDEQRAARDMRIRELPRPLRLRIIGFQEAREHWRRDHEIYELFVCEEAAKIAAYFEGSNAVWRLNEWAEKPHEEQVKSGPEIADGHSGNTFSQALSLARAVLLGNDEHVVQAHGALCPLVGCDDYGCWSARRASQAETAGHPAPAPRAEG